ncbi:MAG: hypothetical protein ACO1TE_13245 [Prosthecobacter sp.]
MKALSRFLAVAFCLFSAAFVHAQDETARHKSVYNKINAAEKSMQKVTATYKDDPTEFALTGWLENGQVRKIVAANGDDGNAVEEIYLENEQPLFVYSTYTQGGVSGGPRIEERLYFKDGSVFKWLTTEKPAPVFHGEDYAATTERLTSNCTAFVAALKKDKASGKPKAAAAQVVEGTFVGVEQGDYAHWNMRVKGGEDLSLFILRPDATVEKVLEKPEAYAGKKCRITVKKTVENLPEAGGKTEVEQILSVEWIGKK